MSEPKELENILPSISILQWNVLADGYESSSLPWKSRREALFASIISKDAHVVCAQEVNHFDEMLKYFQNHGYAGKFLQKPSGPANDGAAVFWKQKFRFVDCLELKGLNGWNQVCLCVLLELTTPTTTRRIAVASTHLKAYQNTEAENLRVNQAVTFVTLMEDWIEKTRSNDSVDLKLFVGDMNSTTSGLVLDALEKLEYTSSYHCFRWPNTNHPSKMVSFCMGGEKALYDYVFFKSSSVTVKYCEELQSSSSNKRIDFPSDHLPLFVEFQYTK